MLTITKILKYKLTLGNTVPTSYIWIKSWKGHKI